MKSNAHAARSENLPEPELRVLLWSAGGSGEHYHGPASFTHRLYSSAPPGRLAVTLAHAVPGHERYPLFRHQHFIANLRSGPLGYARFIRAGRRWIDDHKSEFDVFHGITAFHHSVVPAVHAQRVGIPAVLFIANHLNELSDKPGLKGLLRLPQKRRKLIRELSGFIAMSAAINDELLGYGIPEEKIARIPMGVNTTVYYPPESAAARSAQRRELQWRDLPTVIFVGGITQRKCPHLLIEAAGLLKKRGLDCQVAIVGPDHDEQYTAGMKSRAKELQIEEQVIWTGFKRDAAPLFRAADFFCLPSTNEGMAASLIEAMSSGLPPLVTAVSGSVDVVEDGVNGRLIEGDARHIADALALYIEDGATAKSHGDAARAAVLRSYSTDVVIAEYEGLFRRVAAGKPARG